MALSDRLYGGKKVPVKTFDFKAEIKTAVESTKKTKPKEKVAQPKQPKLTPQQIANLQKMKESKQKEITDKAKKDKAEETLAKQNSTPKVPYGTKGYLVDAKGKNLPRVVNPVAAGITKVASFGTSSLLPGMKEAEAQAQKQFPKSYIAGQVLGYAGPTGLATGLTKGLVKGATKKLATETGKRVVEGAIVGTTAEATQIVKPLITKEITPEQAAKQLATGLVAGAGLDIGIGVLGKVLKALPKSTMNKIKSGATLSKAEKNNIVAELGLPKGTTADDYIRQMQDLAKSDDIVNIPKQREADQIEQYYKSLEKEAPTQQQIVKPLMAQEQSLVKPIAQATDTGKAKPFTNLEMNPIVEEPKQPKQYFTGSSNPEIKTFVPGGDGSTKISGDSYGKGVYLTSNPDVAKSYAQGERGKVYNIEFENPVLDLDEKANEKFVDTVYESLTNSDKQYRNRIIKEIPYTETSFDTSDEAIKYYGEMENVWKQEDGVYEANKPEPEKVGNKFIVKHKDFKTDLKTNLSNMTNREIFESISKINTDSATDLVMQSGFDGIEFLDSGAFQSGIEGKTAVIYRNTDKFKVDQPSKTTTQATKSPTTIVKPLVSKSDFEVAETPIVKPIKSIAEDMGKPVSERIEIPIDTQQRDNFRRTIHNSLMQSELPDDLKLAYESTPSVYNKVNNEEDWAKAWEKVSRDYDNAKSTLRSKDALNSADDTMEYIALLQQASKKNISEAKQLADEFAEKGTKAGQAVQAIVALQKTTPEGQLVRATQTIKGVEDAFKDSNPTLAKEFETAKKEIQKAIKEQKPLSEVEQLASKFKIKMKAKEEKTYENLLTALREKYKLPTLSDEEAQQIVDLMEQGNKSSGREQQLIYAKVDGLIADKVPATLQEKSMALRNMSLLGNLKTLAVKNPLGNIIFSGLENVSQIPSGITDAMVSKILKTPRTTKVLPNLLEQGKGFKKGVSEAWEDIVNNVDTSPTRGGAELPRNRKVFETAWLNKANNWLGDALKMGDRPFYQGAYDARIKELKELQPNLTEKELKQLANEFGLERTFQNNSQTAQALSGIKQNINKIIPIKVFGLGLGDIAMPYTQTTANILEKGVQYTPANLINVLTKLGGQAMGKETIRNNPKAFADAVGRTLTGTGAIALGYSLAKEGLMTGSFRDDSTKKKAIKKQVGEQQYSVKIGDKWYSFDWAQPASIPLAIGVDAYLSGEDEQTFVSKLEKGLESGIQTVFEQSVMQGISKLFGGNTISGGVTDVAASMPSQFVPTLLGQTAQQKDPYKRDADYTNLGTQAKTTVMKKIPTLREQLPATLDLFGKPIKEQGGSEGILKALKIFISPSNVSNETSDKISKEIYNLYKRTGETDVIPSKMPTGLTKEQEYQFKQTFGEEVRKRLETVISGNYDNLSDDAKIKIIRKEINTAYDKAKDTMNIGKK